jgi:D-alanine-D-alanine ligase
MDDYETIIDNIVAEKEEGGVFSLVLNLCDGDEVNGTPGVSVVQLLEEKELVYTGSDEYFYRITTSKIPMKQAFDKANVPNAKWEAILSRTRTQKGSLKNWAPPLL